MNSEAKWFKYYGDTPKTIDYPDISMYEIVNQAAKNYPANIASTKIIRHFNPKYPYEYLDNHKDLDIIEEIKKFYASH